MGQMGMTFTRKGLYDMLSRMTMRQIAENWHLDLRALCGAIKEHDIPSNASADWIASIRGTYAVRQSFNGDPDTEIYVPYSMDVYPREQSLAVIFGVEDRADQFEHNGLAGIGLNKRALRCLTDVGINTVTELLNMTIADLCQIKNLGPMSVENVVVMCGEFCRKYG